MNIEKWEGTPPGAYIVRRPPERDQRYSSFEEASQDIIDHDGYAILFDPHGSTMLIKGQPPNPTTKRPSETPQLG